MPANLENSSVATGLEKVSFHSNPKERQCQRTFKQTQVLVHLIQITVQWHPTPVLLPGISHGQRSLVGCSPCGHEESGATEQLTLSITSHRHMGFPAGSVHKEFTCNSGVTGDSGLIPGLGRSSGGGHGNLLQYSCLENPMDKGVWWATYSL